MLIFVKVLLALEPSAVMAAMQTTTMSASITAYSTAVGLVFVLDEIGDELTDLLHVLFLSVAWQPSQNDGPWLCAPRLTASLPFRGNPCPRHRAEKLFRPLAPLT